MNLQLLGGEEAVVVVDFSQTLSPSYFLFKHQVFCKTLDLVLTLVIVHNFTCFYEELPCSSVSSSSGRKRQILLSTRQKGRRWPSAPRWWWTGDCRRSWGPRCRTGQGWLGCSPPDPDSTGSWRAPLGSGRGNVSRPVGSVGGVLSPEGFKIIEELKRKSPSTWSSPTVSLSPSSICSGRRFSGGSMDRPPRNVSFPTDLRLRRP